MKPARAAAIALLLAACSKDPSTSTASSTTPPTSGATPGASPAPAATSPAAPAPGDATAPARPSPRVARAEAPAPELTLAAFKAFTRKRSPEVRRCYEAALASDERLRGKLTVTFAILPSGAVSEVRVARSTVRSSAVSSCIVSVVRGWRTPFRPSEPVDVEYPIDLRPR